MRSPCLTILILLTATACSAGVTVTRTTPPDHPPGPRVPAPSAPTTVLDHLGTKRPTPGPDAPPRPGTSPSPGSQGGGGGGGGGPAPDPQATATPRPRPSVVWTRPTTAPSLPPRPSVSPTPRLIPIDAGTWRLTVTLEDGSLWDLNYALSCQADGSITVDGGTIPQVHDWKDGPEKLGWQGNHLYFVDASSEIDGTAWHLFYELTASSPTTVEGYAVLIGPEYIWHFPTQGRLLP